MTRHFPQPDTPYGDDGRDARGLGDGELAQALRAAAAGSDPAVASVELLIGHGEWLRRDDLRRLISVQPGFSDGRLMAVIDWDAVLAADLPASSGEAQVLAIAAELAGTDSGRPLADLVCGLDDRNLLRVLRAISRAHGPGNHPGLIVARGGAATSDQRVRRAVGRAHGHRHGDRIPLSASRSPRLGRPDDA